MDKHKTKVIFRKFREEGDIIAIFPELDYFDYESTTKMSYMHIGQHGACELSHIMNEEVTEMAFPLQYASLRDELTNTGYNLDIIYSLPIDCYIPF